MASIGSSLGPYQLKAKIGAGGMGEVYLAFDSRLGRDVAIKILPPQFIADPERVRRFEQEARATAALSHPNILAIFDVGTTEDAFYVVTEFLEGETLRTRINNGALATRKAMDYATQIACGLAAAHDRGIIHRDLKPENIFVTRDGRVKILDFGLAKLASGTADDRTLATKDLETGAGVVLGTLGYMSPEQVRGGSVDARSDLFSFGAILYEMVSGQRAFHCATAADTISAILNDDPPELSTTGRDISPGLERIVRHCLEKDPEERFQSARDLMFALQGTSASSSQAVGVPPLASARTRRKGLRTIAGACLGAMVCVGTFLLGWFLKPAPSPTFRQITFRQGTVTAARFAPDGQNLVYSAAWDGTHPEIFSARTDSVLSRSLDVRDADVLAMSSQGEIALLQHWRLMQGWTRSGTLTRTALAGGAAKELLEGIQDADWSSDGNSLAIIRSKPHYQLEFPVGHVLLTAAGEHWMSNLRVAPGQHQIAFFDHPFEGDDQGSVCIIDVDGKKQVLSSGWSSLQGLAWSPSGKEIWFTGSNTGSNRSLYAVHLSGKTRPILQVPGSLILFDIARTGQVLLSQESARRMVSGLTPGQKQERDLSWLDFSRERALTPDGRWFVFSEQGDGGGPGYSVYIRKTDGSPAVRLGDGDPSSVSADGKWVLALPAGYSSLYLLPTGPGEPRVLNTGNVPGPWGLLLPDSRRFLILSSQYRFYIQSIDSKAPPRPITPEGVHALPEFTADGKYVFGMDADGKASLYPIDGGERIRLKNNWSPEERLVGRTDDPRSVFIQNGDLPAYIYRFDFTNGKRQLVWRLQPADPTGILRIASTLITPDGKYYVYGATRRISNLFAVSGLK